MSSRVRFALIGSALKACSLPLLRIIGGRPTVMCRSDAPRSRTSSKISAMSTKQPPQRVVPSLSTSRSRQGHGLDDYSPDLLDARPALEHLVDSVLSKGLHPFRLGNSADLIGAFALDR